MADIGPRRKRTTQKPLREPSREPENPLPIFGWHARRFCLEMDISCGPLAFKSCSALHSLSEFEQALLISADTEISELSDGVPLGLRHPNERAHFTEQFTGGTAPRASGIGGVALFCTDNQPAGE